MSRAAAITVAVTTPVLMKEHASDTPCWRIEACACAGEAKSGASANSVSDLEDVDGSYFVSLRRAALQRVAPERTKRWGHLPALL